MPTPGRGYRGLGAFSGIVPGVARDGGGPWTDRGCSMPVPWAGPGGIGAGLQAIPWWNWGGFAAETACAAGWFAGEPVRKGEDPALVPTRGRLGQRMVQSGRSAGFAQRCMSCKADRFSASAWPSTNAETARLPNRG